MDDESEEYAQMNMLEGLVWNLNEGLMVIHDQATFDKGVNQILDAIRSIEEIKNA